MQAENHMCLLYWKKVCLLISVYFHNPLWNCQQQIGANRCWLHRKLTGLIPRCIFPRPPHPCSCPPEYENHVCICTICGYDKFTPCFLPTSRTIIFIDKAKERTKLINKCNCSKICTRSLTVFFSFDWLKTDWKFKEPDLLVNEFPWCSKWSHITGLGGFWLFCMAECFELSSDSLSPTEEPTSTRLAPIGKHFSFPLSFLLLLSVSLPHPPPSEAAHHLKKKWEETWIKTEGTSLRYVSWCSSDL